MSSTPDGFRTGDRSPRTGRRIARALKRLMFSLLPLLILFLALETAQRIRYVARHHERAWLLYGFIRTTN